MGQYWKPVNLTKREYIHPHRLGSGMKLREQLGTHPGTAAALLLLCAAMPEARGGGDPDEDPIIGRWAGDRIALVGDYAEDGDLKDPLPLPASKIYAACDNETEDCWTDISDAVSAVLERELDIKYTGEGWRKVDNAS